MTYPGFKRLDTMSSGRAQGIFDGLPIPADKAVSYLFPICNFFSFVPLVNFVYHWLFSFE